MRAISFPHPLGSRTRCSWPLCPSSCTDRYALPLCHEHVLLVWSLVDLDIIGETEMTRDDVVAERQRIEQQHEEDAQRRREHRERRGEVYYLRVGDRIKIGHTTNLYRRMRGYPPGTEVLVVHPGTVGDEQAMHHQFHAFCVAGREWYSQAPELLAHIEALQEKHGTPAPLAYDMRDPHRRKPTPRVRAR